MNQITSPSYRPSKFVAMIAIAGASVAAHATVTVPLDSLNLGGSPFINVGPELTFDNVGGSGVKVTWNPKSVLRAYDLVQFGGSAWTGPGTIGLIDMPWDTFSNPLGAEITFSQPVSNFSMRAGDFGSDDDEFLRIEAFDAGGTSLGTHSVAWGNNNPPFATLQLAVPNISRIVYKSGGPFANSTFFNEVKFDAPVPEPATLLTLAVGALGIRARRNKAKRA